METTNIFTLNPAAISNASKIYDHIKAHAKKGMIQITDFDNTFTFSLISGAGDAGIINFCIRDAIKEVPTQSTKLHDTISFRNQSFGNTFMHSREFFGKDIDEMRLRFYRRYSSSYNGPEFVESLIKYTNNVTCTQHTSVLEPIVPPVDEQLRKSEVVAKLILSIKTCTLLLKWLRQFKGSSKRVKVHINENLSVLVLTIGEHSKTVEFKGFGIQPTQAFLEVDKAGDFAAVLSDCTCWCSLESLIHAICICKVPGNCVPAFKFYSSNIIEVIGAPVKQNKNTNATISVVLLNVTSTTEEHISEPISELRNEEEIEEAVSNITPVEHKDFNEEFSDTREFSTGPFRKEDSIAKRKRIDTTSKKTKKQKLSFTSLI